MKLSEKLATLENILVLVPPATDGIIMGVTCFMLSPDGTITVHYDNGFIRATKSK